MFKFYAIETLKDNFKHHIQLDFSKAESCTHPKGEPVTKCATLIF